jgi:hypothetical protein
MLQVAQLLVYLVFAAAAALAAGTVLMAFTLRRRFPGLWAEWGSPEAWLWLARTPASRSSMEFLERRSYLSTEDQGFIRLCSILRVGYYAVPVFFVVAMGGLLFVLFKNR